MKEKKKEKDYRVLFRAKTEQQTRWVYGLPAYGPDFQTITDIVANKDLNDGNYGIFGVKAETLGQYTGFKDKHGQRIFEGDIIQYEEDVDGVLQVDLTLVFFDKETAGFMEIGENATISDVIFDSFEGEIIGNVHDCPDSQRLFSKYFRKAEQKEYKND